MWIRVVAPIFDIDLKSIVNNMILIYLSGLSYQKLEIPQYEPWRRLENNDSNIFYWV